MSAKPREETDSEGRWFGEDFEKMERVRSTVPRFDETEDRQQSKSWEDETYEKQFYHQPASNQNRPPVTMETASTDGSDLLRKAAGEGDLYTSLLSNQSRPFPQGFSADSRGEARDPIPGLETRGMFSSDSGIEMTPGEPTDFTRNLLESEKMEAYNYMDISHGEKPRPLQQQQQGGGALGSWGEAGGPGLGQYMEKNSAPVVETIGPGLGSQAFPYVEEPSDEEPSDRQPGSRQATPLAAGPIKITLTETDTESPAPQHPAPVTVSDRDSILSLGLQGIPTVTLSEPEDDSPGSSTPPFTEESDSPSEPLFQASAPSVIHDQDGSSAESGDSEIELVSEEPSPRQQPPSPAYAPRPRPAVAPPPPRPRPLHPVQHPARGEEAELDSELIIESLTPPPPRRRVPRGPRIPPPKEARGRGPGWPTPPPPSPPRPPLAPAAATRPGAEGEGAR
ncbi:hypothetical protein ANANG_G00120560 [Anguilla anguilla]|uniref:Uncharacterized protein n=1 Tax=Anguilla anguilla TaxID=7936 RepID=A0A9D3MDG3_ANGAN|nr:hypothetical protein ANANG_G00120560 [Anguilla anguilla]